MFVDTVIEDKALHKPVFLFYLSITVLAIFFAFNFTNTIFGEFLSPVIGVPEESGLFGRFVVSFVLEIIFVLGLILLAFILFVTEKFSLDLTALLILTILFLGGFLTVDEAISGFSCVFFQDQFPEI